MFDFLRNKKQPKRPDTNVIETVNLFNRYSTYPSSGLTPERLASILREADQGDIYRQMELFEEMLEKDLHLAGIFGNRKLGVTRRSYQIMSASEESQHKLHAEYVTMVFNRINNFRKSIEDILDAVPKGFSALQIYWNVDGDNILIDGLEWLHQKNFRFGKASDVKSDMKEIRRLTDSEMVDGVELEPYKWIIALIQARSGHPARTSLLRTCSWMYLFKNFDVKAWIQFAEIIGVPIRVGKYSPSDAGNTKLLRELENALINIGKDSSGIIPNTMQIEFIEAAQKAASAAIHADLANFCNAEMSKGVLGHSGSADSTPGKLGGEDGAMDAVYTLVESDAQALDYIFSDQLIKPLINFKFGIQKEYPYYKTLIQPPKDRRELIDVYDGAINRIGIPVAMKDIYEDLGLRQPSDGEEIVMPRPVYQPTTPMQFSTPLHYVMDGGKKKR